MSRKAFLLTAAAAGLLAAIVHGTPAHADDTTTVATCTGGWYVNPDETDLKPVETAGKTGLLFDGPSLVHHATAAVPLSDLKPGAFQARVTKGVAPLLKYETAAPYSTVNQTSGGLFWSSKIPASGQGGQDHPLSAADLAAQAPYTAATTVDTFGIGYGNDTGNTALVTSITYAGTSYIFVCPPTAAGGGVTRKSPAPLPTHVTGTGHTTASGNGGTGTSGTAAGDGNTHAGGLPTVASSPTPLGSFSPDPDVVFGTPAPTQSVVPVMQDGGLQPKASPGSNLGTVLGISGASVLVLLGLLVLWMAGHRRTSKPRAVDGPATRYATGIASGTDVTRELDAIDERGKHAGDDQC